MEPEDKKISTSETKHKLVQTYTEDMVRALEDSKGGEIKKIIHGEEEHEAEKRNLSPESKKNRFFMFSSFVLIVASVATLLFFLFTRSAPSISVEKQFVPIIFTDKSTLVEIAELKKDEIANQVFNKVNTTAVKTGGIEGIYLTLGKAPVGLKKFIELITGNFVVGESIFVDDNFLMGVAKNKNQASSFFMLIKVRSIADVFDAMHAWENKMFTDLHGFFGIGLSPDTKYLLTKNFENGIIENKNARILYDKNAKIVLAYVFADDNSIIITNSENTVREIILRLATSQIKK